MHFYYICSRWVLQFSCNIAPRVFQESHVTSVSSNTREPKLLWLAQTVATRMTTMCPWILAPRHSALPRLTVLRISTFLWALGHITLIFQDSLQHYLPVRGAVPPYVTGRAVSAMLHHHPSTVTSNLIGNVSFWQQSFHRSKSVAFDFLHHFLASNRLQSLLC